MGLYMSYNACSDAGAALLMSQPFSSRIAICSGLSIAAASVRSVPLTRSCRSCRSGYGTLISVTAYSPGSQHSKIAPNSRGVQDSAPVRQSRASQPESKPSNRRSILYATG